MTGGNRRLHSAFSQRIEGLGKGLCLGGYKLWNGIDGTLRPHACASPRGIRPPQVPRMKVMRERRGKEQRDRPRPPPSRPDLSVVTGELENVVRSARVYVFSQDKTLANTKVYSPHGGHPLPSPDGDQILAAKQRVLQSGQPQDAEAFYTMPEGRVLFSFHINPTFGPDDQVDGIMCAAIDVTRVRSLESEQQRLTAELGTTLQRYETALRGSNVTVFTQDRELRYTSISNPMFGRQVREIVGHTDDEIIAADNRSAITTIKLEALESGQARDGEVRVNEGGSVRWYDLHVEPLRDVSGAIVGLTC